jgi:signal peptidase I
MRRALIGMVLIGVVLILIGFFTEVLVSYKEVRLMIESTNTSNTYNFPPLSSKSITCNVSEPDSILRVGLLAASPMVVYVQLGEEVEYMWEGSDLKRNVILTSVGTWVVKIFNNSTMSNSCTYTITVKEFQFQQEPTKPLVWLRTPLLVSGGFLISLSVPLQFYNKLKYLLVKNKKKIEVFIAVTLIGVFVFSYQIAGFVLQTSTPWSVATGVSMQPTIYEGDMVIVQGTAPENLVSDDIILFQKITETLGVENFQTMETPVLHRIVEAFKVGDHWYYMTQGDHNPTLDDWLVPDEGVMGKAVFIIPKIGFVLAWLGTFPAKIFLIALIVFVAFILPSVKPKKKQSNSLGQTRESGVSAG